MRRTTYGWSLPPGVTDRMIDEAAPGYYDEQHDADRATPELGRAKTPPLRSSHGTGPTSAES